MWIGSTMNAKRSILLAILFAVAALLLTGLSQAKASTVPSANYASSAVATESPGVPEQTGEESGTSGIAETSASMGVPTTLVGVLALAFLGGLILQRRIGSSGAVS